MSNQDNERPEPYEVEATRDACRVYIPDMKQWIDVENEDDAYYLSDAKGFLHDVSLRLHYKTGYPEKLEKAAEVHKKYNFRVLASKFTAFAKAGREIRE